MIPDSSDFGGAFGGAETAASQASHITAAVTIPAGPSDGVPLPSVATCQSLDLWTADRLRQNGVTNPISMVSHLQRICDASTTVFTREVVLDMAVKALRGIPQNAEISELAGTLERLGTAAQVSPRESRAGSSNEPHGGPSRKGTPRANAVRPGWPVRDVETGAIIVDTGIQARVKLDPDTIADYAEAMASGVEFPPVIAFEDPETGKKHLADGFHRAGAAEKAGLHHIRAEIRPGTRRDAILFAVGANATHGLPRRNADKRRAVRMLLEDPEWVQWNSREIARQCGVSHTLVDNLRGELSGNGCQMPRICQRNGTEYAMVTGQGFDAQPGDRALAPSAPTASAVGGVTGLPMPLAGDAVPAATTSGPTAERLTPVVADTPESTPAVATEPSATPASASMSSAGSLALDLLVVEPRMTAEGLLTTVFDTLAGAPPEASPSDCRELIRSALWQDHPRFCLRVQHLLGAAASSAPAQPASGNRSREEGGVA
jgi:hypothetical protein